MDYFTFRPADPLVKYPKEKGQFQWTGYLQLPQDSVYTFQRSATNMALTIDKTTLFTTRGGLGDREETAQIALAAGLHRLQARWQQAATVITHSIAPSTSKAPVSKTTHPRRLAYAPSQITNDWHETTISLAIALRLALLATLHAAD